MKSTNYVVAYTILPQPDDLGVGGIQSEDEFRELISSWEYKETNPKLTEAMCSTLAKRNCKRCHKRGIQHWDNNHSVKWTEACQCVKNYIEKMPTEDRLNVFGF